MSQKRFYALSVSLLALPRAFRILWPALWVEDSFYLYAGNLVRTGWAPFKDFVHTQYPGVEWLLAVAYGILGPSTRGAELLTQTMALAASLGVLVLGVRLGGRRAGLVAGILFSWHSLLFRYHLAEREIFALVPACAIMWLVASGRIRGIRSLAYLVLATTGILFKLTFVLPCLAASLFLLLSDRKLEAVWAGILTCLALLAATTLLLVLYGEPFLWQAILYHFAKGANVAGLAQRIRVPRTSLDLPLALAIPALLTLGIEHLRAEEEQDRPARSEWALPVAWILPEGLVFTTMSPDLWPHNYIGVLPGLCLLSGMWLHRIWGRSHWQVERRLLYHRIWLAALPVLLLATVVPLRNQQWTRGSVYGLGFVSRAEARDMVQLIQENASPEERVLVPEYLALDAGRRLWIEDRMEAVGVIHHFRQRSAQVGIPKACRELREVDFWTQSIASQAAWKPRTNTAILRGEIPVIIPYLHADFQAQDLKEAGYVAVPFTWYDVWIAP